jgi:NADH:ubiquinone oxidoreductase subunit D
MLTSGGSQLKPIWANGSGDPISKMCNTERAGGVAQDAGHEFKSHITRKKTKNQIKSYKNYLLKRKIKRQR